MTDRKASLVIDVQRIYMEPEPMVTSDSDDLIEKCRGLIDKARAAGVPVVYVRHLSDDQPDDPDLIGVHPELAPQAGEPVVQKRFGSAFFKTNLEKTLKKLAVEMLYVCGLATFGCVNATVMCAVCKGHDTVVVKNAHGSQGFPDSSAVQVDRALQRRVGARWRTPGEGEGRHLRSARFLAERCAMIARRSAKSREDAGHRFASAPRVSQDAERRFADYTGNGEREAFSLVPALRAGTLPTCAPSS